ncbi:DNA sulfur modification protein DndB [Vibrio hangzhouensis]|uniref:DNA sulfur modification protein DndB n=1 Tax=Vibrio hangzhouensis TaxID=462991 RepID=UPI001C96AC66|nr:DNA sulfur modification protein DndB [Vibrio hangzhouensis]MBY6197368.1 hypothetical protein [Vibrio hangzhouensis]
MHSNNEDIEKIQDEIEKAERSKKRLLKNMLDELQQEKNTFLALKGEMGEIKTEEGRAINASSYSVVHDLDWIGRYIKMGSEMPLMKNSIDSKTGRLIIDEANAEEIKQRAPDFSRQVPLTIYLSTDKNRKFGSILAVISPSWVDEPNHENWGIDGRALRSAFDYSALDTTGNIGMLNLDNHTVFALDGQHRVMGIRGLQALSDGPLFLKGRSGEPVKGLSLTSDHIAENYDLDLNFVSKVLSEKLTVEYIPSVIVGETREDASRRIRDIFYSINKYAKTPDKGEQILLNESDGYAIVARKVGLKNELFKREKPGDRINWKNTSISKRSTVYTTLQQLFQISRVYLTAVDEVRGGMRNKKWEPLIKGSTPVRPDEAEIIDATEELSIFFNLIAKLPVFRGLNNSKDKDIEQIREFSFKSGGEVIEGRGHLLLRPIGQVILTRAVAKLLSEGYAVEAIFDLVAKLDSIGGFDVTKPSSIWYEVTFDATKKKMIMTHQETLAPDLLKYMLIGANSETRKSLIEKLVTLRAREDDSWIGFDGQISPIKVSGIELPSPVK